MRRSPNILVMTLIAMACIVTSASSVRADGTFSILESGMLMPIEGNFSNQIVSIPQFDPSNGTLCFVVIRVTANYDALVRTENTTGNSGHISVLATQTLQVTPPNFVAPVPVANSEIIPYTSKPVTAFDGVVDYAGTSSANFTYSPTNPRNELLVSSIREPADFGFGSFIGNGSYNFSFDGSGSVLVYSNTGALPSSDSDLFLSAKVEVEYLYIPEPATLALFLPGLLLIRRRRRA